MNFIKNCRYKLGQLDIAIAQMGPTMGIIFPSFQMIIHFTFLILNLTRHLIQTFAQISLFLLWLPLLIQVLQ